MAKNRPKKERPRSGGLGSLADALLQAGQLSEKRARNLSADARREVRRDERRVGRKATQEKQAKTKLDAQAQRVERSDADREAARTRTAEQTTEQVQQTIRQHLASKWGGSRRWFFVARDRRVPLLRISDQISRQLTSGDAGIVEAGAVSPHEHGVVLGRNALETLIRLDPEAVRFWVR